MLVWIINTVWENPEAGGHYSPPRPIVVGGFITEILANHWMHDTDGLNRVIPSGQLFSSARCVPLISQFSL